MSKIGLGNNINQPTKQRFSCKYWKAATKLSLLELNQAIALRDFVRKFKVKG